MNKFQLAALDTESLVELSAAIKHELSQRKRQGYVDARRKFVASLRPQQFDSKDDIENFNASLCLRPPSFSGSSLGNAFSNLARYISALLAQDWRSVYEDQDGGGECYVYCHVDPRGACFVGPQELGGNWGGEPFYIGKGSGNRAFDLKRNQAHGKRIAAILSAGFEPADIVRIIKGGMSEGAALCLEAKLVFFFGTQYQEPAGFLVNLDVPKTPPCDGVMRRFPSREHWVKKWRQEAVA
jgi:hypothetical protein